MNECMDQIWLKKRPRKGKKKLCTDSPGFVPLHSCSRLASGRSSQASNLHTHAPSLALSKQAPTKGLQRKSQQICKIRTCFYCDFQNKWQLLWGVVFPTYHLSPRKAPQHTWWFLRHHHLLVVLMGEEKKQIKFFIFWVLMLLFSENRKRCL